MSIIYNVPSAPGVPPMLRSGLSTISSVQGVIAGVQNTIQFFGGRPPLPTWGIFDSKFTSVVSADSILGMNNRKEGNIPNFQVQGGKLAVYNKVQLPFTNMVRISKSGSQQDRQNLLRQLDTLQLSLDNYIIVTPEKTYQNVNCLWYEINRMDKDQAYFLTEIDLFFQEIPTTTAVYSSTPAASTTNAIQPSAQPPVNNGVLASTVVSPAAQATAIAAIPGVP